MLPLITFGCQTPEGPVSDRQIDVPSVIDARPPAIVDGFAVTMIDMRSSLMEAAGGEVLAEIVLDRKIEEHATAAGIAVSDGAIAAERERLIESLDPDPDRAVLLLDELRRARGLGPDRFDRLMRRNALLRAAVAKDVRLSEAQVIDLHDALHGPRRQVRLCVCDDLSAAQRAAERAAAGESFAEVTAEVSTDSSAPRGGLVEPFSARDPSWPPSIRTAAWALAQRGEISAPVLVDGGYAIIQFVREVPGDGVPLDECRAEVESSLRLAQERLLMDNLARRLLAGAQVTIFDSHLEPGWRRARVGRDGG